MAEKRTYELMFIVDPDAGDEDVVKLSEGVQKIIEEHVARRQNHHARLWALLMFMNWHEQYDIDRA